MIGANGAGKSSLLEAVYVAATTRSFRTRELATCARRGAETFAVTAEVGDRPTRALGIAWSAGGAERRIDGKHSRLADHLAVLPVLAWSAEERDLVAGGPAVRRRFVDRGLVHLRPAVIDSLARYRAALAEKRALLAGGGDLRGLEAWNALLARHGSELARARAGIVATWAAALAELAAEHAPELPPLALRYRPASEATLEGEGALLAELERRRRDERARGRPLVGPHRDDVEIAWDGASARLVASAGERKALGLLLLAALARTLVAAGRSPTLLVDDADAELDAGRTARVIAAFGSFESLLLTSSRAEPWASIEGVGRVDAGALASHRGGA